MRQIPLTRGKVAVVDDTDYEWLNQWKWNAHKRRNKNGIVRWYAVRPKILNGKQITIQMHCLLLPTAIEVDHIDTDGLNNTRSNLRPATRAQNQMNKRKKLGGTSQFKGVDFHEGIWRARIYLSSSGSKYLGAFHNEVEAAMAYDAAARHYFGEFARPNFP